MLFAFIIKRYAYPECRHRFCVVAMKIINFCFSCLQTFKIISTIYVIVLIMLKVCSYFILLNFITRDNNILITE